MRQERRQFRHPDILPYAYEIPCQVTPSKGLIRQADRYKPMVFPIVIFIRDIGYIGIRHILFTELPDQVVVQVSSYSHRITIIINQRYTETIDISRTQIGIPDLVAIVRTLYTIRIQGIERRTFDITSILPDQHPPLDGIERIGHAQVRKKIQIIPTKILTSIRRLGIFRTYPRSKRPVLDLRRERGVSSYYIFIISQGISIFLIWNPATTRGYPLIQGMIIHQCIGIFGPDFQRHFFTQILLERNIGCRHIIIRRRMTPVNRVIAPTRLFITDRMEIIPG